MLILERHITNRKILLLLTFVRVEEIMRQNVYTVECYYESNLSSIMDLVEKNGGKVHVVANIPVSDSILGHWVVIYTCAKELDPEIFT